MVQTIVREGLSLYRVEGEQKGGSRPSNFFTLGGQGSADLYADVRKSFSQSTAHPRPCASLTLCSWPGSTNPCPPYASLGSCLSSLPGRIGTARQTLHGQRSPGQENVGLGIWMKVLVVGVVGGVLLGLALECQFDDVCQAHGLTCFPHLLLRPFLRKSKI